MPKSTILHLLPVIVLADNCVYFKKMSLRLVPIVRIQGGQQKPVVEISGETYWRRNSVMIVYTSLPVGQQQARSRWGTHVSGAAFDRKKFSYLTEQAHPQLCCSIGGLCHRLRLHTG